MFDSIAAMFGTRVVVARDEPLEPTDPEEEYGGNSLNDPNPSGNPDEDDPGSSSGP